jgi:hypothetical protein
MLKLLIQVWDLAGRPSEKYSMAMMGTSRPELADRLDINTRDVKTSRPSGTFMNHEPW